jgi:hypothetical protein
VLLAQSSRAAAATVMPFYWLVPTATPRTADGPDACLRLGRYGRARRRAAIARAIKLSGSEGLASAASRADPRERAVASPNGLLADGVDDEPVP